MVSVLLPLVHDGLLQAAASAASALLCFWCPGVCSHGCPLTSFPGSSWDRCIAKGPPAPPRL